MENLAMFTFCYYMESNKISLKTRKVLSRQDTELLNEWIWPNNIDPSGKLLHRKNIIKLITVN